MSNRIRHSPVELLSAIREKLQFLILTSLQLVIMGIRRATTKLGIFGKAHPSVFSLDAHVSVVEDLRRGLRPLGVSFTTWCIAGSNRTFRKFLIAPDPVRGISSRNWKQIDGRAIEKFNNSYRGYLKSFDGFLATYPPAFAEAYEEYGKPMLVITGTRYEWPYTFDERKWNKLNQFLVRSVSSGRMTLVANNRADADYINYFTGLSPLYVPSLCDYIDLSWDGTVTRKLIHATRSPELSKQITRATNGEWLDIRSELGSFYSWSDLAKGSILFVIPYNISTMTLFELATMGVPVVIPSRGLLKELRKGHPGVLSDLSFLEMRGAPTELLSESNPNNYNSGGYLDWWLDRADFYNSALMPNVVQIDDLAELDDTNRLLERLIDENYMQRVEARNRFVFTQREELLATFVDGLVK